MQGVFVIKGKENILVRTFLKNLWHLNTIIQWQYDKIQELQAQTERLEKELKRHTVVHADVHFKDASHIVVCGRYMNSDYVRIFTVDHKDLKDLIQQLKRMEKGSKVGRIDLPARFNFSTVYPHETF